ncbi:uncharacterized protein MELLADRAFT_113564 [Melampsora larici-populina 98AG31]|uniref:Ubiquitin-like domain-containing protein n=1 Tax=Melampsora larici-populina (strain 98AG31 / pathotype 3-4-7) TaxID=747676 RepID=F4SAB5_MELLP|nr:uncharacterized protein MELLADRAFT_113564 [Melampsora larici-populina 98AG31]EGF98432.1 hypothetical protein MELLADRAFT_113564 [Melampsora larici-populina 98AG31]
MAHDYLVSTGSSCAAKRMTLCDLIANKIDMLSVYSSKNRQTVSLSIMSNDEPSNPNVLNIRVVDSDHKEICFKIKPTTKLGKVINAYAEQTGMAIASVRFTYEGTRINVDDTPEDLDMTDDDTIDVMIEQIGGGRTE